jgi:pyruvate dehydrogenase E2 component (dihydrolipoamide acetyltransferase)
MATEILLPRQGQSVESCIIVEWKKKVGDTIKVGDIIAEVETDKANFEVESTADGVLLKCLFQADDDVAVLTPIALVGNKGEDISGYKMPEGSSNSEPVAEASAPVAPVAAPTATPVPQAVAPVAAGTSTASSPRARRLADSKGVVVASLHGTGPGGRVIERDVQAAQANTAPISPAAQAALGSGSLQAPAFGSGIGGRILAADLFAAGSAPVAGATKAACATGPTVKEIPVKGVRKVVAERMMSSLSTTAQLTLNASADAREILSYRSKLKNSPEAWGLSGVSINDLILYVTARTLGAHVELNAHFLGTKILQFSGVNLGFAVDTPRGLLVPVIKNADRLSLKALASESKRLASACIAGNADPADLSGGTFTVTNLGAMGIESFTPVLNAPEVAILGVCNVQPKPVMKGDEVSFIPHMGLSLTFNHAATDGAPAARFLKDISERIAQISLSLAD